MTAFSSSTRQKIKKLSCPRRCTPVASQRAQKGSVRAGSYPASEALEIIRTVEQSRLPSERMTSRHGVMAGGQSSVPWRARTRLDGAGAPAEQRDVMPQLFQCLSSKPMRRMVPERIAAEASATCMTACLNIDPPVGPHPPPSAVADRGVAAIGRLPTPDQCQPECR